MYQTDEKVQTKQRQIETAIQLARANRWKEAVTANRAVLKLFPNDADSHNRLGKALMELGRYAEAKKAYKRALAVDATNQIAKKNLERLDAAAKTKVGQAVAAQVDPEVFIEEMGKSAVTVLQETSPESLARLSAGDQLRLRPKQGTVTVATPAGRLIGVVEPKLSARLVKLMEGGNEYAVAVTSLSEDQCQIIIKETYRDPSQAGRPSFVTPIGAEATRPYTKQSLVRHEAGSQGSEPEPEPSVDGDKPDDWQGERVAQEGHVRLNDAAAAEDADDDDELEE